MVIYNHQEINYQQYERSCLLTKFINRLDADDNTYYYPTEGELNSVGEPQKVIIKRVYSMLYRNYNNINAYQDDIKKPCCNYLNYWLDTKKNNYVSSKLGINDAMWKIIEKLWENLEKTENTFQCKRNINHKTIEQQKNRINLMVYCVNRDELKKNCNLTSGSTYQNFCLALNEYVKKNYELLVKENQCLKHKDIENDYEFHFSNECTLYDIPKTFPDYNTEGGTLSENPITRNPLPYCESTQEAKENFQGSPEEDTVSLVEEPSSPYSAPWNSMTYSSLTVFGILLSSMFLYK
ncbi:hypothetical protein POWCR01_000204100, partial [Plasmodium ovale]